MSVENLSDEQVARYGRFAGDPTPQELEEFFFLDEAALEFARTKRRGYNRLGWAVQWGTVRMLGMFLMHPSQVPDVVAEFVAEQLGGVEAAALKQYPDREQTQWDHSREVRDLLGLREFESAELELRAFVAGRVWVSNEGPRALFDRAVVWLIKHRVLLPRITTLARLVPEVRTGEMALINSVIDAEVSPELRRTLLGVLEVPEGDRVSTLERWRTPVRDVSGRGQRTALLLAQQIRETNGRGVDLWRVPEVKTTELARFGLATKAPKLRQLAEPRRTATLLSTVRHLESASIDDALTLFDVLMATKLLARAQRADVKEKLRTWPKLRKAATKVGKAVEVLLETPAEAEGAAGPVSVAEAWTLIEQVVTRQELIEAMAELAEVLPPPADGDADAQWRTQLMERYATVRPFIALLGDVVPWGATEAGAPVIAALEALPTLVARRKPAPAHIDERLLSDGTWKRLVLGNPELAPAGLIDKSAWTFCVLDALHTTLKRRDVFAVGADTWGDPRARLLAGPEWIAARGRVTAGLDLPESCEEHLGELRLLLDETYRHVAEALPDNAAASVKDGRLRVDRLSAEVEPAGMKNVRDAIDAMMPKVDYPELLLEVDARTGMFGAFEHISGMAARRDDLEISLTALLVSKSTNIGLEPVVKPGEPALTRGRLIGVDYGHFNLPGITAASTLLVKAQGEIPIARDNWGGGLVASADGMRFAVPVRNLHARPSRRYFPGGAGATWLNVVSDRVMGLGGIVMPGTLRDSLGILDAVINIEAGTRPEVVITDTASYSDLVFGLFAILGYQFSPRIADISDARLWRFAMNADYGALEPVSRQRIQTEKIEAHWEDMLRVAGSLQTGRVRAHDLLRMMSTDGRTTGLGEAFAHYGRIFKTLHLLQYIDDEAYRRMIGVQLNIGEARHALARRIFFGRLGELRQGYREGMEDQLGALGLALNAVVYWNSLYIDAAVNELEASGWGLSDEIRARLSPLVFEHINFHGRYPIVRTHTDGQLRALRPLGGEDAG